MEGAREPMEANKAYEKDYTFKSIIWLNYEIKYWHRLDNLTKRIPLIFKFNVWDITTGKTVHLLCSV